MTDTPDPMTKALAALDEAAAALATARPALASALEGDVQRPQNTPFKPPATTPEEHRREHRSGKPRRAARPDGRSGRGHPAPPRPGCGPVRGPCAPVGPPRASQERAGPGRGLDRGTGRRAGRAPGPRRADGAGARDDLRAGGPRPEPRLHPRPDGKIPRVKGAGLVRATTLERPAQSRRKTAMDPGTRPTGRARIAAAPGPGMQASTRSAPPRTG